VPDVDVLIVNYLTADLALTAMRGVAGTGVQVHVWDNSGELLAQSPAGLTVHGGEGNVLYAVANNRLFCLGSAPWVLLLNPDVVLHRDQLLALVAAANGDPAAWGAAPALRNPNGTAQNYRWRLPTLCALLSDRLPPLRGLFGRAWRAYRCLDDPIDVPGRVEQPAAACLLLRRAAVTGPLFDESYPLFFNDTDLARRLNATGHCLYVPSVSAIHVGGASVERVRQSHAGWIRREYDLSLLRYARRNVRGWWLLIPVVAARRLLTRDTRAPADLAAARQ
jgi:N-acetylglucosaminyl-diphospho-decaprenol L-rhamnosyltransferase